MREIICSVRVLVLREWQRIFHEPSRIAGMFLQPLLFLGVFGVGFHRTFLLPEALDINYSAYFFPGILALVVLFASIYSTLSLVEDKQHGFFAYILLAPGGIRGAILGKVLATMSLAFLQSLLFLPLVFFLPINKNNVSVLLVIAALLLGSLVFSLIGVLFAWLSPSASAFHALMSIILLPMWLLSGSMFPIENNFFNLMSYINPMSFLVIILRKSILNYGSLNIMPWLMLLLTALLFMALLFLFINKRRIE